MILMMCGAAFGAVKSGTFNALSIVSGDETSNLNRASCGRFSFIASSAFFNADSSDPLSIFPFSIDCGHLSRFRINEATPAKVWNFTVRVCSPAFLLVFSCRSNGVFQCCGTLPDLHSLLARQHTLPRR